MIGTEQTVPVFQQDLLPAHVLDLSELHNFTAKRLTTTTPLQSLALYNNDFMLSQANYFAKRIKQKVGDKTDAEVQQAFLLAFARVPTDRERVLATNLVETQGLFALCRSLFNANEFVYVD